jgi:hypothetical protein
MGAEPTTGFDLERYKYELDKTIEQVMPESWSGHARIAVWESDVPEKIAERVTKESISMADNSGATPEAVARQLIDSIEEKMN